ncbi:(2,3-dihydroxybenzoyl)adenylate synthase [Saccharothrix sp. HUAS TT1]|uniref:(2,3-dihydroxybenzoyl)adenylate synthase n=1 Tax=unclassified Saccharothrix TaxID=2593673 RepID=UPI00345BCB08
MRADCTPWPEDVAAGYRRAGYWRGDDLGTLLSGWAAANRDRTALVHRDRRVTYAELDEWAHRLAAGFAERGIRPGDRVLVQLPNIPEFVAVHFALLRAGAHPVFALPAHRATEIGHLCAASGAVGYVVAEGQVELAARAGEAFPALRHVFVVGEAGGFTPLAEVERDPVPLPRPDPSDVAFFLLSGGTTALPKLVPRTHDDYAYQLRASVEVCSVTADDVYLAVLPIEFNLSLGCPGALGTLHAGGTVVLVEEATAGTCFELVERERVTFTALAPTIVRLWLDEVAWTSRDLSSLRTVLVGGAPLPVELARRTGPALGCVLTQSFGMAEGFLLYSAASDDEETRTTTQGRPLSPADELRIVDDEERDVAPGEAGHLLVRGPYTIRGYFRSPEHNAKAFTADGFYRTGDIVRLTPSGSLAVEGRAKDVIIRGGDKISPAEVEGYLLEHPAVRQVAVVAMPDDLLGERTCAFVTAVGDPPAAVELKRMLHARGVADFKLPDRVEFVDALPLTPLGKVDRGALRAAIATGSRAGDRAERNR